MVPDEFFLQGGSGGISGAHFCRFLLCRFSASIFFDFGSALGQFCDGFGTSKRFQNEVLIEIPKNIDFCIDFSFSLRDFALCVLAAK